MTLCPIMLASLLSANSALRVACVQAGRLPAKLNGVLQPIMNALRRESEPVIRALAAPALAKLVDLCHSRSPSPNAKCALPGCHRLGMSALCTFECWKLLMT